MEEIISDSERDVSGKERAGDAGKSRRHRRMDLARRHAVESRLDQNRRFSLQNLIFILSTVEKAEFLFTIVSVITINNKKRF